MDGIVFIVYSPGGDIENVILVASDREAAKRDASRILHGNPDNYVVDPITQRSSRTVFLLAAR